MNGALNKKSDFLKKFIVVLSTAVLTILLTQEYFFTIDPLKQLELKLIDKRFSARGPMDLGDSSDVIIVEITQSSYDQIPQPYNKWPWPRFIFAHLIKNLTEAGVKAIGIDINMSGPDQFSPLNDSLMRAAIKKSGKVVVAGIDVERENLIAQGKSFISGLKENYKNIFYDVDSSMGIVQPPPDYDGVFRRYLPFVESGVSHKLIPSFGFALLNKYYGLKNTQVALRQGNYFKLGKKLIPQYDRNSVLINFYGPSGTFPHVPLIDVLDDKDFQTIDEKRGVELNTWDDPDYGLLYTGKFKNKVVIIGSTMPEDRDLIPISFAKGKQEGDNLIYGAEFHANLIQNVIRDNFLYRQTRWSELFVIVLLTGYAFYFSSLLRKVKLRIGLLIELINFLFIAISVYAFYELSVYLFIKSNLVIAIVSPTLALVLGYFSSTAFHFLQERQKNVLIKGMFSQYVSKNVVNELLADPDKLRLGGEKKELTILFSDIAGFTSFSEKKQPEELVSIINEFLNEMSEIIINNEGTVDKYLGDAIMAFWGAPVEVKNHAVKACLTALQMQAKLTSLRDSWTSSGEMPIFIRIGIHTGNVIVGNIGGVKRFDYTVIGDAVNLASRLEGANKEYSTSIMISDSTYELVKEHFYARELDVIRVKGKTKTTKVYELVCPSADVNSKKMIEEFGDYSSALALYRSKNFEPAFDYFKRSYEKLGDYPSKVYMDRCEFYLINPPGQSWDGVFEFETK